MGATPGEAGALRSWVRKRVEPRTRCLGCGGAFDERVEKATRSAARFSGFRRARRVSTSARAKKRASLGSDGVTTWEAERSARLSRSRVTETAGVGAFDCCESWGDGRQGVRLCVGAHLRAPSSGELEIGGRQPPERRDGGRAHDRELPGEVLDGMGTEFGRRGGTPQTRRVGRPQRCMDALRGTKRALFRPFPPPAPPTRGFSVSRDYA